jgi:hypothetical protein
MGRLARSSNVGLTLAPGHINKHANCRWRACVARLCDCAAGQHIRACANVGPAPVCAGGSLFPGRESDRGSVIPAPGATATRSRRSGWLAKPPHRRSGSAHGRRARRELYRNLQYAVIPTPPSASGGAKKPRLYSLRPESHIAALEPCSEGSDFKLGSGSVAPGRTLASDGR